MKKGIKGNAGIVISDIRNGILLHTGEWKDWKPTEDMPNSHGCEVAPLQLTDVLSGIHAHPEDVKVHASFPPPTL